MGKSEQGRKSAEVRFDGFGGYKTPDNRVYTSLPSYATAQDVLGRVAIDIGYKAHELVMQYLNGAILTTDDGLAKKCKPDAVFVVSLTKAARAGLAA